MKALAIVAMIFAIISIFIPVFGVFLAMLVSVLALISFRSEPIFSGVAFGVNIISTAFLSPSIVATDIISSTETETGAAATEGGSVYLFYVGFHVVLLIIAIIWRVVKGAPEAAKPKASEKSG